jgi:hypothetical protein
VDDRGGRRGRRVVIELRDPASATAGEAFEVTIDLGSAAPG